MDNTFDEMRWTADDTAVSTAKLGEWLDLMVTGRSAAGWDNYTPRMISVVDVLHARAIEEFASVKDEVVPGRSVLVYRNGFPDGVKVFASTWERDRYVAQEKAFGRKLRATSLHFELQ